MALGALVAFGTVSELLIAAIVTIRTDCYNECKESKATVHSPILSSYKQDFPLFHRNAQKAIFSTPQIFFCRTALF